MNNRLIIILLCIASGVVGFLISNPESDNKIDRILEIDSLRMDIVRMHESNITMQSVYLDSMSGEFLRISSKLKSLEDINRKLQKQNEKLDLLYNSIIVDMPEF